MKWINVYIKFLVFLMAALIAGCSSGEYDVDIYKIKYTEKTLKIDTIKKIVEDDRIREDFTQDFKLKEDKKVSYSFVVQIGAFLVKSYFERFFENAKIKLGSDVYYDLQNYLYKIRIGKFNNRAEAMMLLNKVKALGYDDAFIISERK